MKSIYSDDYIAIILALRQIRTSRNITQAELATTMGVHQSFISKIENRERRLDVLEFLSWIDALGISVNEVLPPKYRNEV